MKSKPELCLVGGRLYEPTPKSGAFDCLTVDGASEAWLWRHPAYEADGIDEYTKARAAGLSPLDPLTDEERAVVG